MCNFSVYLYVDIKPCGSILILFVCGDSLNLALLHAPFPREQAGRLSVDVSDPWKTTNLQPDLDELQRLLDAINVIYNAKKNALVNSVSANDKGQREGLVTTG